MNIHEFAVRVTLREGKKVSISVAQIKEVLKIINNMTCGEFYKMVRRVKLARQK